MAPPSQILLCIVVAQRMAAHGQYSELVAIYLALEQEHFADTLSVGAADSEPDSLEIGLFSAPIEVEPAEQTPVKFDAPTAVVVLVNPNAAVIAEVVVALFVGTYGEADAASYIDWAHSSQEDPTEKPAATQLGPFEIPVGE